MSKLVILIRDKSDLHCVVQNVPRHPCLLIISVNFCVSLRGRTSALGRIQTLPKQATSSFYLYSLNTLLLNSLKPSLQRTKRQNVTFKKSRFTKTVINLLVQVRRRDNQKKRGLNTREQRVLSAIRHR